ncbi:hypothetical protein CA13_58600 [Planctomycetes bacterium CA13]|uniref:Uncharacterized protein n=1 Tax=Novipirellula herctigrandis TaxID=2527986 RepID=A0A5C5ZAM5_9BACT|nr:hypothetical protein CA13_58600 [Planctomycetes bacterium CA13]
MDGRYCRWDFVIAIAVCMFCSCVRSEIDEQRPVPASTQTAKKLLVEDDFLRIRIGMSLDDVFTTLKPALCESMIVTYPGRDLNETYFVVFAPTNETGYSEGGEFRVVALVRGESFLGGEYLLPKRLAGVICTGFWSHGYRIKITLRIGVFRESRCSSLLLFACSSNSTSTCPASAV